MKTQMVCPICRGGRSVANFAYPGHVEACPRCEAVGHVAVADGKAVLASGASGTVAANDTGKFRKLLKEKLDLLILAIYAPTSWGMVSELSICACI